MEMTTYSTGDLAKRLGETRSSAGRQVKRLEQYSGPVTRNVRGQFRLTEQEVTWVEATRKMVSEGNVSSYADAYDVLLAEKVRAETAVEPEPDTLAKTIHSDDPFNGHAMNPREGHAVPLSGSNGDAKTVTNEPANGTKKSSEKQIERTLNDLSQNLKNWWTVIRREVF